MINPRPFEPGARFGFGLNLPWVHYGGDFGANLWRPAGGLAATGLPSDVSAALERIGRRPGSILRWFLFCDGRAGIAFGPDGVPSGLDGFVLPDLDAALQAAEAAGVQIVFSLIDFLWCRRAREVNGVQIHGRRTTLERPAARAGLINQVFTPLFKRYGEHQAIAAWEVINEPEWATFGAGTFNPLGSVRPRVMRGFIAETVDAVHAHAGQPVTVGSASARGLWLVRGLGLDFYQLHWYDRFHSRWPLTMPVSEFGLEKPVVLGELPTRGSAHEPAALLAMAREAGYAGAWLWSLRAEDGATDGTCAMAALEACS